MKLPHRYNSLALRLVLAAALWIGAALLIGGLVLSAIFQDYAERTFDGRLSVLLDSLIAVTELDETGRPKLTRGIGEPRFDMPYSGWYWEIAAGRPISRSTRRRFSSLGPSTSANSGVVASGWAMSGRLSSHSERDRSSGELPAAISQYQPE